MAAGTDDPVGHVVQHPIVTRPADFGLLTPNGEITVFSDHISMLLLAGLLLVLVLPWSLRRRKSNDAVERLVPTGFGHAVEVICQYLRQTVAAPILGKHTDRFIKYIWSVFFFILTINLLGMLPIPVVSQFFGLHIGGTATANIWVTATLALMTFVMMIVNGLRLGGMAYIKHFNPGPWYMAPFLVPIEVFISLPAKIVALTLRLFANMVAGHLVLAVLLSFIMMAGAGSAILGGLIAIPVVAASVALSCLELLVAFLQAFIFTYLTTLFIGMSINVHHDEHAGEQHEAAAH